MSIPASSLLNRMNLSGEDFRQSLPSNMSLLMPSLPPPPPPPNTISSPIMLDQLNGSKPEAETTYRRLEPAAVPPPTGGGKLSPVLSPSRLPISSSPALPVESASINGKETSRHAVDRPCDFQEEGNMMEHNGLNGDLCEDPLAKLQNALQNGFLSHKLFSPVNESHSRESSISQNELFQQQQQRLFPMSTTNRVSPDSYQNGEAESTSNAATVYRCHLCSFEVHSKQQFNNHMNSHFDHKCPFCDYTSRTEGRLKRHVKDFHSEVPPDSWAGTRISRHGAGEDGASEGDSNGSNAGGPQSANKARNFKCKQCEHVAKSKNEFWEHSKVHIKTEKLLTCPKCPFVTEYKHHLEYHLRNHFGSKPFKCGKCNYSCVNKSMLNSHSKSHSNVYQYRCKDCAYATKYCHSLKLHLRKYKHQPAVVLNLDGSPNPYPVIDVYGTRRGPRPKRKPEDKSRSVSKKSRGSSAVSSSTLSPVSQDARGRSGSTGSAPYTQCPSTMPPNTHWMYPQLMASFHAGMFAARPTLLAQDAMRPEIGHYYCPFCNYTTLDQDLLSKHIMGHATPENQDFFNMYGVQTNVCRGDEGSDHSVASHDQRMSEVEAVVRKETPPLSEEMDASLTSPPCPVSSPAPSHDELTEEYYQEEEQAMATTSRENGVEEEPVNDIQATLMETFAPKSAPPVMQTPPKSAAETSSPLDLSHPREERQSSVSGSRNRRKGKAFKLHRLPQVDPVEMDEDHGQNYPETMIPKPLLPKDNQNQVNSDTVQEPKVETLESTDAPIKTRMVQVVEKQSPTSSSSPSTSDQSKFLPEDNVKPSEGFKCDVCEISFGDCVMYAVHMGYHDYLHPFKCNMCGQESKDKVDFFLHIARSPHL